jgi:pyruvate/2-oxoacid:ferredoxin oxidoreductase alpha subunit
VIVNVMRAGPGLGNIWPEQGDYNQAVKGGGHGNYRCLVLAPNSAQEMCDHTIMAFDLAEKYMGPVYVLTDGYVGQMKEPVVYPEEVRRAPHFDWALYGDKSGRKNLCSSIIMSCEGLEKANIELQEKYARMEREEVLFQEHHVDDAQLVIVAYGITSRIAYSAIDELRAKGLKVGLLRPITLFPFPTRRIQEIAKAGKAKAFMSVELSNGQMVDDVRLALNGKLPVEFYGRMGGMVPSVAELAEVFEKTLKKIAL